jgi:diketogulonate reductase-like aldo/keto reductase
VRNLVVIAKSTHRERIEENAQIFDFTLSDQDMAALDALDRTNGTVQLHTLISRNCSTQRSPP